MEPIPGESELERLVARSRLIGADRSLVLHGGGNTSTKLVERDHLGRERLVLRIKASGSDLGTAATRDFPGLWLDELLPLRERTAMTDDEMVAYLARCLVEPGSGRPSIETLLHAFLPAAHVDHVHADAICALANAPDPEAAVHAAVGEDVAVVPYLRPGFELSKRVAKLGAARAVVLVHHGLVTWGDTHEESYRLTRELVDRAADHVGLRPVELRPGDTVSPGLVALRGRLSRERRQVLAVDAGQRALADREDVAAIAAVRSTPDHMLRIGRRTCVVRDGDDVDEQARVFLVPGVGCVAAAPDLGTARARLEIAAHTHTATAATRDAFGGSSWLDEHQLRDFEQWPLQNYKLTLAAPPPELAGTIAIVSGAASGIGRETALELARRGAHLVLADLDADGLARTAEGIEAATVVGDVTEAAVAARIVDQAVTTYGGVDAVVFGAGIASAGELAAVSADDWRRSLDVNLTSHFLLTRRVWPVLVEQGIGGSLVYIASKNAFAPGAGFGPYSVAKAGLVQLARIAALEGGASGIRANVVNPDAVFGGSKLWSDDLRRQRADAHGIAVEEVEAFYARRSLLGRAVTAHDVAEAVAFLVSDRSRATTGSVLPVDGGVPHAFPR